jgi:hypothetical protein
MRRCYGSQTRGLRQVVLTQIVLKDRVLDGSESKSDVLRVCCTREMPIMISFVQQSPTGLEVQVTHE